MKLWLDDQRKPPWGFDLWAKDYDEAIALLSAHKGELEHVSLDHDLCLDDQARDTKDRSRFKERTGYDVALYMVEHGLWPTTSIHVHTLNGTGGQDMMTLLERHAPKHITVRRVWPPSA